MATPFPRDAGGWGWRRPRVSWVELGPVVHPGQGTTPEGRGQGRGGPLDRLPRGHRGDTHTGLAPKALREPPILTPTPRGNCHHCCILQMHKLRGTEVQRIAQGYLVTKWHSQGSNPDSRFQSLCSLLQSQSDDNRTRNPAHFPQQTPLYQPLSHLSSVNPQDKAVRRRPL